MSNSATSAGVKASESRSDKPSSVPSPSGKGKSKVARDDAMDEDDEEEDEDEDEDEEEEGEDEVEEEDLIEIDPSVIITQGRRTRGVKVDYSSKEAIAKAGLQPEAHDEDEEEFVGDNSMKED